MARTHRGHPAEDIRGAWFQGTRIALQARILFWRSKGADKTKSARTADSPCGADDPIKRVDLTLRLPDNILREIILYFVLSSVNPATAPCIEPNPHQGPLLVSQVSRHWRQISLTTPNLWSAIYVGNKPHVSLLKLWLNRSGSEEPLFLKVHTAFDGDLTDRHPHLLPTIIDILAGYIHRWKEFGFALALTDWFERSASERFCNLPFAKAVRLERLSVHALDNQTEKLLDIINHIPFLRHFHLDGSFDGPSQLGIITHDAWSKLNSIRLSIGLSMDDAFLFISKCTAAVEISLDCINEPWSDFFKDKLTSISWAYTVANLRVLRITNSACDCTPLLQYLKLPSLRVLQLHNFETGADCVSILETTLSSSRKLRQLSIVDYFMGEVRLWSLLRSAHLGKIPSVGIYTHSKNIKWDMLLDTVPAALNQEANMPRREKDGIRGAWYGWGPGALASIHAI